MGRMVHVGIQASSKRGAQQRQTETYRDKQTDRQRHTETDRDRLIDLRTDGGFDDLQTLACSVVPIDLLVAPVAFRCPLRCNRIYRRQSICIMRRQQRPVWRMSSLGGLTHRWFASVDWLRRMHSDSRSEATHLNTRINPSQPFRGTQSAYTDRHTHTKTGRYTDRQVDRQTYVLRIKNTFYRINK